MKPMRVLVNVILLVALMGAPTAAQTVYRNDDVCYPVFEVSAQTEKKPATSFAEQAGGSIATFATTGTGTMVEVAVGPYNVLGNHNVPVIKLTSVSDRSCRKQGPPT
jgi:hypothetical protein